MALKNVMVNHRFKNIYEALLMPTDNQGQPMIRLLMVDDLPMAIKDGGTGLKWTCRWST